MDELPTLEADGSQAPAPPPAGLPESIGQYRILGKLGQGGMGTVLEAEQQHPRRRVALKVIRSGELVDDLQVRMFKREADSLARLKHPSIGSIYEAGRTESGRHFFAMELVRGERLDKYLGKRGPVANRREIEHRLRLFEEICDAVHYAHQRGVIHRDLKPSNVIVLAAEEAARVDSKVSSTPRLKVLDFGLARITDTDVAAATIVSEVGTIKGTLPYMSPEQALGRPEDIDLRSDVYSLGVILYEMLAGIRPYDTASGSLVEAVRIICEEPPRPLGQAWSGVRRPDDDLETIVGKSLQKDPDERYGSVAALADDIDRYLTSQPIQARPPSTVYQLRKLVERNKVPSAFAAATLLLIVGFGIWMSVLYRRAEANLTRAVEAEAEATLEAETATQVSDFMVELFQVSDPSEARGNEVTAREILDRGAERIEQELSDQPVVEARLLHTIGRVYRNLGLYQAAEPLLQTALKLRETTLGPDHPDLARSLDELGVHKTSVGEYEEAEALLHRALEVRRSGRDPDDSEEAETLRNLAEVLRLAGRWDEAEEIYDSLLPLQEKLLGAEHPELARTLHGLARVYHERADFVAFEEVTERSLRIREIALEPDHPEIAASLHRLGDAYKHNAKLDLSENAYKRALEIRERVLGPEHSDTLGTMHNLAGLYSDQNRLDEAQAMLERVLPIAERTLGPAHMLVGFSLHSLSDIRLKKGDPTRAAVLAERALSVEEQLFGADNPQLAGILMNVAEAYWLLGRSAEAEGLMHRTLGLESELGPDHLSIFRGANLLANIYRDRGEYASAEPLYERAIAVYAVKMQEGERTPGELFHDFGVLRRRQGRREEALELFRQALEIRTATLGPRASATLESRQVCAALLRELGRKDEAERLEMPLGRGTQD